MQHCQYKKKTVVWGSWETQDWQKIISHYMTWGCRVYIISTTNHFGQINIGHGQIRPYPNGLHFFKLKNVHFGHITPYLPNQNRQHANSLLTILATIFFTLIKVYIGHIADHIGQIKIGHRQIQPQAHNHWRLHLSTWKSLMWIESYVIICASSNWYIALSVT